MGICLYISLLNVESFVHSGSQNTEYKIEYMLCDGITANEEERMEKKKWLTCYLYNSRHVSLDIVFISSYEDRYPHGI